MGLLSSLFHLAPFSAAPCLTPTPKCPPEVLPAAVLGACPQALHLHSIHPSGSLGSPAAGKKNCYLSSDGTDLGETGRLFYSSSPPVLSLTKYPMTIN